jgi:glycosyltransferase involved in cell wall biosynthesis
MTDTSGHPIVTVVIPTLNRSQLLVQRALRSALSQTLANIEVVVVVDGPDPATIEALEEMDDPRLRWIALPENAGGSEARNIGVRAAQGDWIALLDDDDEWMPYKLERQLDAALHSTYAEPVVVSGWITRTPRGDTVNPPRLPDPGESIGDYMLARRGPFAPPCGFMSSVIFARRRLMLAVPLTRGLPKHQDWDWVLRAAAHPGVGFEFVQTTCAVWYFEEQRDHMSRSLNWRTSLDWAQDMRSRELMSDRAYVGFINSHLAAYAEKVSDRSAIVPLFQELTRSQPRAFEVARFVMTWLMPLEVRRGVRTWLDRVRGAHRGSAEAARTVIPEPIRRVESQEH